MAPINICFLSVIALIWLIEFQLILFTVLCFFWYYSQFTCDLIMWAFGTFLCVKFHFVTTGREQYRLCLSQFFGICAQLQIIIDVVRDTFKICIMHSDWTILKMMVCYEIDYFLCNFRWDPDYFVNRAVVYLRFKLLLKLQITINNINAIRIQLMY